MRNVLRSITIIVLFSIPQILNAGPPFLTDDPDPVQFKHWEYYISSQNTFNHSTHNSAGTLPHFEVNYGLVPNVQVHLILPLNYDYSAARFNAYGYANTELGVKYRFVKETDKLPEIGTFPILQIPTVSNPELFGGRTQLFIPVWIQKSWNKLTSYGGAGYWINPGSGNKNYIFAGWQAQYEFSKMISLGAELYCHTADAKNGASSGGFNLGGFVNFSEKFHFIFSAGHSITNQNFTTAYAGFLWTI
jgi:hypothetical protein